MTKKRVLIFLAIALFILNSYFANALFLEPRAEMLYSAEKIAARVKPAIVQIEKIVTVSANVPELKVEKGRIIGVGPPKERSLSETFTGSGFIVTPDGYIVTNAHVVQATSEDIIPFFIRGVAAQFNSSPELKTTLIQYLEKTLKPKIEVSEIAVLLPISGLRGFNQLRIKADLRKTGEGYPGKDVAILKIPYENLPTIDMTYTEEPAVGANVLVIGYPGAARIGSAPNEATVTSGIISAYKTTDGGWKLMQIDAPIGGGNSGGPVFDVHGHAIGIATLKSVRETGFNWAVPSDVIKEFLDEINVRPARGILDNVYERALMYYWKGRYNTAITEFYYVLDILPQHPLAPEFILKSRIMLEKLRGTFSWGAFFAILGFAVAAFIITILIFKSKKQRKYKRGR